MFRKHYGSFIALPSNVFFLFFLIVSHSFAKAPSELAVLSNQVQQLLKVNSEKLVLDKVMFLSEKIISNRQHYSNDIIAKVFLLRARVASNQGDINQVYSFSKKGLAVNSLDKKTNLSFLLKIAEVYVAKKQYQQLLELTERAVNISEFNHIIEYQLISLSYRSVAFAMLGKHLLALADLQQVEQSINKSDLSEHIELLTILALAYHRLNDYQTSLIMQQKILKLRFDMKKKENVERTYLYLGYANFYLLRLDEAYNAFWESKEHASKKKAPIHIAHANKGLGLTLIKQKQFSEAIMPLTLAIKTFQLKNMQTEQIESMIALVHAKLKVKQISEGYALLNRVLMLLNGNDVSMEYTGFYRLVAEMHFVQKDYKKAYQWSKRHSGVLLKKLINKKKARAISHLGKANILNVEPIEESRILAVKLAGNSELSSSFIDKYRSQNVIIISLLSLVVILIMTIIGFLLRLRVQKSRLAYEEMEKPIHVMTEPMETKSTYQSAFQKSRKFKYPLTVGYLVVDNWQELTFLFNKKSIKEVIREIASLVNQQLSEFDRAGLLNEGEYLLLFEHQTCDEATVVLDNIVQALNSRSFANLGDFSIVMKYSLNTPDFKDIDPYLFLARIAESVNIVQSSQPKVL